MQNYCIHRRSRWTSIARTFLEIAHSGSFLKAADRLHVTQTL
ncbi:MAG: LysR family transcriptional regulator [Mesorhizobium sp.]|nr:MAG: LysR family transcriptional regulator [Mesorhizobium sp.]